MKRVIPKMFVQIIDEVMHRSILRILPVHDTPVEITDTFADFFTHNITKTCTELSHAAGRQQDWLDQEWLNGGSDINFWLPAFTPVTENWDQELSHNASIKVMWLKSTSDMSSERQSGSMLPALFEIVNHSMSFGNSSDVLMEELVTPVLKHNRDADLRFKADRTCRCRSSQNVHA